MKLAHSLALTSLLAALLAACGSSSSSSSALPPPPPSSGVTSARAAATPMEGTATAPASDVPESSDILNTSCRAFVDSSTKAFGNPAKFWTNKHSFTVKFMNGNPQLHKIVLREAAGWTRVCNVNFVQVTSGDSDFHIGFYNDGHWSYVGKDCREIPEADRTMNLAITANSPEDDIRRVVLHEFGHALGLEHEHQHPDTPIIWNEKAVINYYAGPPNKWSEADTRRNVINRYTGPFDGSPPDLSSIMQYPVHKEWTQNNIEIGWNRQISTTDASFMRQRYGAPL